MITLKGKSSGDFSPIVGEVTLTSKPFYMRSQSIYVTDKLGMDSLGYKGCITSGNKGSFYHPNHIYNVTNLEKLHNGDIVSIDKDGTILVLWENDSTQNCLFVTENCNCRCIMCPQPPKNNDSTWYIKQANEILDIIKNRDISDICITGGEPSTIGNNFFNILRRCTLEHPNAYIAILTNGKNFAKDEYIDKLKNINLHNVTFCISYQSEVDTLHDYIVGVNGSYNKTQKAIYNLARTGAMIEIRTVISKLNYKHLPSLAEHLYNYFPFCVHYAFMGMEIKGYADENKNELLISPLEYKNELKEAILILSNRGLNPSVYNLPLCCIDEEIRQFSCKSISSWKNSLLDKCSRCIKNNKCAGFFTTSSILPIDDIKPFI